MDWSQLVAGLVGLVIPALLARLKIKVPVIVPEAPGADRPLLDCYKWCQDAKAGLISVDPLDLKTAAAIKPLLDELLAGGKG
jgi:hypothetical protein